MASTTEKFFPREEVSEERFFPREEVKDSSISLETEDTEEGFWKSAFKYGMGIATLVPQAIGEVMSQPGRVVGKGGGIWEEVARGGKEAEEYWVEHKATRPSVFVKGLPDRVKAFVGYIAGGKEMAKPYIDALNELQGTKETTIAEFEALPQEEKDKFFNIMENKVMEQRKLGESVPQKETMIENLVKMRRDLTKSDLFDSQSSKHIKNVVDYTLSFPEIVLSNVMHTGGTLAATGLGAIGMKEFSKNLHLKAAKWQQLLATKDEPDFAQRLTQGLSSIGTFYFIGVGATSAIGAVKILSPTAKLGSMVATMTAAESSIESGSVWQQVYLETGDEKKANEAAKRSFLLNVGMIGLTLRYGFLNPKLKGVYGNLVASIPEGFQEFVQSDIERMSMSKPISPEESLDSAVIGFLSSAIFKSAMDTRSYYKEKNAPKIDKVMGILDEVEKLGQEHSQVIKKDIQEKIAESEDVERVKNVFERKGVKPVNMEKLQETVEEGRHYSKKEMVKEIGLEPKQISLLRDEGHVKYEKGKGWVFLTKASPSVAVENEEKISALQKQIEETLVLDEKTKSVGEASEASEASEAQEMEKEAQVQLESKPKVIDPKTGRWSEGKLDRELLMEENEENLKSILEDIDSYVRRKKHIKLGEFKETEKTPFESSSLAKGVEISQEKLEPKSIAELARKVQEGHKEQDSLTSLVKLIEQGDPIAIEKSLEYLENIKKMGVRKTAYDLQFEKVIPAVIKKINVIETVEGEKKVEDAETKIEVKKDYGVRKRIDLAQKKLEKSEVKKEHKAEVAELKRKKKGNVTLEAGGLQTIYENLMEKMGFPENAQNDLFELGKYLYDEGATQAKVWAREMKDSLGKMWDSYKKYIGQIWKKVREFNEKLGERGEVDLVSVVEEMNIDSEVVNELLENRSVQMPVLSKDTHYEKFTEKMTEKVEKVEKEIFEMNENTPIGKLLSKFPEPHVERNKFKDSLRQWIEYFNKHLDPKIYNLKMLNYIINDPNFSKQLENITFKISILPENPTGDNFVKVGYLPTIRTVLIEFYDSTPLEYILEAMIEEITHGLTLHKISESKELNDKVTKLREAFVKSLPLSQQFAIKFINEDINNIREEKLTRDSFSSLIEKRNFVQNRVSFDFYHSIYRGTINAEFIVGAWSDKLLRNKLAKIPYQNENKSLLQKIQETIKEFIFGVPPTQQWTLLDELFSLTEEIARTPFSSFVGKFIEYSAPEAQQKQDKESIKKEKDSSVYSSLVRIGIQKYKDGATTFQDWSDEMKKISNKIPNKLLQRVYNSSVGITKTSKISFDAESKYGDPNKPVAWYKVKGKKEKQEFRTHRGNPRLPITESLANMINLMNKDISNSQSYVFRNILKNIDSTFGTDFLNIIFKTPIIPTRDVKVGFMEVSKNAFKWIDDTYKTDFLNVIFRPSEEATKNARLVVLNRSGELNDIMKKHNLSYKNFENIMSYAIVQQKGGVEALTKTKQPIVKSLSEQEQELYDKMIKYFESDFIQFNEARRIAGKHPIEKVENYFTWQRIVENYYENGIDPITIEISDFIKGFETKMPNAKNRVTGAMKPFEMNVIKVFHDYQTYVQRYIHLTPILAKMREMLSFMKEVGISTNSPKVYTYLNDWTNYEAGIRKNEILGSHVLAMTINRLTRNIADAVMVANMKVFLTQFSSFDAVVAEVGIVNFQKGLRDFMDEKKRKFVEETSRIAILRVPETVLMDSFMEVVYNYSKYGMTLKDQALAMYNASRRYGYKHIQISDNFVAKVTWLAAYNKALSENKNQKESLDYADDILLDTQGSASSIHLSPLQKTTLGKFMSLFGTFIINRYGWLKHGIVLPITKGKHIDKTRKEAFRKLIVYYFMAGAIDWFFEELLGINSPNPTPAKSAIISYNKDEKLLKAFTIGFEGLLGNLPIIGSSVRYGGSSFGPVASYIGDVVKWVGKEAGYHKQYTPSAIELIAKGAGVPGMQQVKTMYTGLDKEKTPIQVLFGGSKKELGILGELMD